MQVDVQKYLDLVENANTLGFFDIESTGFRGDYNSILVGSIKCFYEKNPRTFKVARPGNDKAVVRQLKDNLEALDVWVTYYGKGFDIPMLNTRLLKWGYKPVEKRPHLDLYYSLKAHIHTSRKSQAHLLEWLKVPEGKMTVSADVWNEVLANPTGEPMQILVKRCESDVRTLQGLYRRTRHVIEDLKR